LKLTCETRVMVVLANATFVQLAWTLVAIASASDRDVMGGAGWGGM